MNNIYDILEICLQELENGADMDALLARYPSFAGELRPILKASIEARTMAQEPSPEVVRRGRAKLLQHAAEMREAKLAPRKRVIPFFQRMAISFTMTALFLASGTGLVGASSSALPGENLYPVKLTWENVRLFFTFDHAAREVLEHAFGNERLHEISELLAEGRHETIQFSGIFMDVNGLTYVSGIQVAILDTTNLPVDGLVNGAAVTVTGRTNAAGFVDAASIILLPPGTVVPTGVPVEVEDNQNENINLNGNDNSGSEENENNGNDNVGVNENENDNENINDNENGNGNDNGNDNGDNNNDDGGDDDGNDNGGSDNENGNDNDGGDNGNDNANENSNENENANENTNENDNGGSNDNDNVNDGVDDNTNDGSNDNTNDNVNDNDNDNSNDNDNDNTNDDNSNDDDNTNDDDNSNDDDNTNSNGGSDPINARYVEAFLSRKDLTLNL